VLSSHAGASFGGIVYPEGLSIRAAFDAVEALVAYARTRAFDSVEMTLPPVVYHDRPSHYVDFALYKIGFRYKKREISSVIPLDFTAEQILEKFKPEARTAFRKSVKRGVRVRETDDFEAFYPILRQNLGLRHHVQPTHTLEELLLLKRLFPDRIRFFGAYLDRRLIAGVVAFTANDRVVLAFYISHDTAYQDYRPVNQLFHAIIRWCIEGRYRCLDFGIFTVNEETNWGLGKFKESFGARGVFRDTFVRAL
jgi:lipid II:glycine glycyltransferase (peptidoglycan interpeptide bridge formation enzyme)